MIQSGLTQAVSAARRATGPCQPGHDRPLKDLSPQWAAGEGPKRLNPSSPAAPQRANMAELGRHCAAQQMRPTRIHQMLPLGRREASAPLLPQAT